MILDFRLKDDTTRFHRFSYEAGPLSSFRASWRYLARPGIQGRGLDSRLRGNDEKWTPIVSVDNWYMTRRD
jgi:hypothetical protein